MSEHTEISRKDLTLVPGGFYADGYGNYHPGSWEPTPHHARCSCGWQSKNPLYRPHAAWLHHVRDPEWQPYTPPVYEVPEDDDYDVMTFPDDAPRP